jgi:RimJ/RimL family protein N-acetyltransferase/SAM-dependent methyltransferase
VNGLSYLLTAFLFGLRLTYSHDYQRSGAYVMFIETQRLILRDFEASDARSAAWNSWQPNVAYWMPDMVLKDEAEGAAWIEWINGKRRSSLNLQVLAVERKDDHVCIGLVGYAPKREIDNEVEVLYAIADPYQSNGYATEAAKAIVWLAFERMGLDMLSAIIKPANIASQRVVEKLGFVYADSRTLPYEGKPTLFDYYRLYHIEELPNPDWDFSNMALAEEMGEFFDRRAAGYEAHMEDIGHGREMYQHAVAALPRTGRPVKILDLGCGTGLELKYLFERMPDAHVTCIDLSEKMLAILAGNYQDQAAQLEIIQDSYLDCEYPAAEYDWVISVNAMHHLLPEDKIGLYSKIRHSLEPGGMYLESDFMVDRAMMEQYQARYQRITGNLPVQHNGYYHIDIPFTVDLQKELLNKAGFGEVDIFFADIKARGSRAVLVAKKDNF